MCVPIPTSIETITIAKRETESTDNDLGAGSILSRVTSGNQATRGSFA